MNSQPERVMDCWKDFESFNTWWHRVLKEKNPDWRNHEMYMNGQFNEVPYFLWDENWVVSDIWSENAS